MLKWHWVTATGPELGLQRVVSVRLRGTGALLNKVKHSLLKVVCANLHIILAMAKFLSGPPGGRTLPQTATRLSDLAGGIFGPGASVASTGLHSQRPAIKAGVARAAGETWEDVLEYYLVRGPLKIARVLHA